MKLKYENRNKIKRSINKENKKIRINKHDDIDQTTEAVAKKKITLHKWGKFAGEE